MYLFPTNFLWGAAASAPQTEGHALSNGKSPSTWDKWYELEPTKFQTEQGPSITSNVYELYTDDIERMQAIGMNSYRTSISWTRLLPDGKTINKEAVAYYRSYFNALNEANIQPIINLFHFDMPWWLMEKGGWETRESVDAFAFFAQTAFELFGDIVQQWTTFNEPIVHIECGYLFGYHYPAIVDFKKAVQVGYHTLMAHIAAVECFKTGGFKGEIGIILNISPTYARSSSAEDQQAKTAADLLNSKSFLDPCVLGHFPSALIALLTEHQLMPLTEKGDATRIANNPVDFLGLNYYQPRRVQEPDKPNFPAQMPADFYSPYDWPDKKMNHYRGWEIYPEALYDMAVMIKDDYGNIPWYVAENGMGVADEDRFMNADGMIEDDYRIAFMQDHLQQLHRGIASGSNCFGYHTWTFVDCWSWLNGYTNRYGFYRMDLNAPYERSLKKSGHWFKTVSEKNGF